MSEACTNTSASSNSTLERSSEPQSLRPSVAFRQSGLRSHGRSHNVLVELVFVGHAKGLTTRYPGRYPNRSVSGPGEVLPVRRRTFRD